MEAEPFSPDTGDARSDAALVAAINAGDADAFESLYRRHRDWVAGLAYRFTADHALALDVLQETFLYLLRKFPGFQLTANLRTFLYPAVRHLGLAARQRAARCQAGPESMETLALTAGSPGPEPGRHETLARVLDTLSPEHRDVLHLRFVDGFKLEEIAAALELPLGTVKSRLHYALDTLRHNPATRDYFDG